MGRSVVCESENSFLYGKYQFSMNLFKPLTFSFAKAIMGTGRMGVKQNETRRNAASVEAYTFQCIMA